jgi:hypothetical protein
MRQKLVDGDFELIFKKRRPAAFRMSRKSSLLRTGPQPLFIRWSNAAVRHTHC